VEKAVLEHKSVMEGLGILALEHRFRLEIRDGLFIRGSLLVTVERCPVRPGSAAACLGWTAGRKVAQTLGTLANPTGVRSGREGRGDSAACQPRSAMVLGRRPCQGQTWQGGKTRGVDWLTSPV